MVWPMVELEADDALASAARRAAAEPHVDKVCIWTPDKGPGAVRPRRRLVQVNRRSGATRDEDAVRQKSGVPPHLISDYMALVGDAADGYPGIRGIGPRSAARLLNRHGSIEQFPAEALGERRGLALVFKDLATLRTDARVFADVAELEWRGPAAGFGAWATVTGTRRLWGPQTSISTRT